MFDMLVYQNDSNNINSNLDEDDEAKVIIYNGSDKRNMTVISESRKKVIN